MRHRVEKEDDKCVKIKTLHSESKECDNVETDVGRLRAQKTVEEFVEDCFVTLAAFHDEEDGSEVTHDAENANQCLKDSFNPEYNLAVQSCRFISNVYDIGTIQFDTVLLTECQIVPG